MIVEIIILLVILWFFNAIGTAKHESHPMLDEIHHNLTLLCQEAGVTPSFSLAVSRNTSKVTFPTFTSQQPVIDLVIHKPDGTLYDSNTLHLVAIHELAHVLCPGEGHPPLFDTIEQYLVTLARKKGLVTTDRTGIDSSYPCQMDDD